MVVMDRVGGAVADARSTSQLRHGGLMASALGVISNAWCCSSTMQVDSFLFSTLVASLTWISVAAAGGEIRCFAVLGVGPICNFHSLQGPFQKRLCTVLPREI
jgi:hypothetical protein